MSHPVSPPPILNSPPSSNTVRRVHTISAASRAARTQSRIALSEDTEQNWNEDDVVDQEWEGGLGAVGEKSSSLHRQASLPARYNRAFQRSTSIRHGGTSNSRNVNSLASITAQDDHEAQEEEWENGMHDWKDDDERSIPSPDASVGHGSIGHGDTQSQGSSQSPLSPHFSQQIHNLSGSPPPGSNIRRHQSLTYGAQGGVRRINPNLKRSGTLQAQIERPGTSTDTTTPPRDDEELFEEDFGPEDENNIFVQQPPSMNQSPSYLQNTFGRDGPFWKTQESEWRAVSANNGLGSPNHGIAIDDVQRALSSLELSSDNQSHYVTNNNYEQNRNVGPPPRFNQGQSQPQAPAMRRDNRNTNNKYDSLQANRTSMLQLMNDPESNKGYSISGSSNILPIGHGMSMQQSASSQKNTRDRENAYGSSSGGLWDQKERNNGSNLQYNFGLGGDLGLPASSPSPSNFLPQGASAPRLGLNTNFGQSAQNNNQNAIGLGNNQQGLGFLTSPLDVPTLIATKGYNPTQFDVHPPFARFFVIKSYTEDDVHKSLKYEIWSSTDPGNKRLDKAFKETANRGPIYLFFSVNASGHFCGMAEMLTPVDYSRSSTVWASDKWKGVFKVRWIFVRDIPNANLRHIKLLNTQERKPVTNSRDTQELLPEAGQEMLRIFFTHPARTSLLQDFAYYELQSLKKIQQGNTSPVQTPANLQTPQSQSPQHSFANLGNQNNLSYSTQPLQLPMNPMMQMQLNSQYTHPAAVQSVLRNTSPIPATSGYLNLNSGF